MNEEQIIAQIVAALLLTRGRDRVVWQMVELHGGAAFPAGTRLFWVFSWSLYYPCNKWIDRVLWLDGRCMVVGMEDLLKVDVCTIADCLRDRRGLV